MRKRVCHTYVDVPFVSLSAPVGVIRGGSEKSSIAPQLCLSKHPNLTVLLTCSGLALSTSYG